MKAADLQVAKRRNQGFTLMEILIVAAIIAIFASLAIFNAQEMYQSNVRKGTIAETNSIGTALSMARDDLTFYPKLNYLMQPAALITRQSDGQLRADFDYIGFYNPSNPNPPALNARKILERWQVMGYAAMSQARNRISQGRGGVVLVRLPSGVGNQSKGGIGQDSLNDSLVEWPADPWGGPYVLYLLKVNRPAQAGTPEWRFVDSVDEEPDFMVGLVSYGPNGVPGMTWEKGNPSAPWGDMRGRPLNIVTQQQRDARLYRDGDVLGGPARFSLLLPIGYNYDTGGVQAQLRTKIVKIQQYLSDFPAPPNPYGAGPTEMRGVLDPGSDDLIFKF
ncbi:MAG: prepilin-type N-terminal cleavage/methylation domain-containing protein [Candidatus Sumerlaeota bacterium]|nr:prepilin-type N-terminal cleavage/methylation domain-containing protein [Candidatus Sumerlaeota bacterium]